MSSGLPAHVEESDLISYGLLGLISAIERFDPGREIKFETFAMTRIKGSIIDELRSLDWVPRSVRARARQIEKANAKLEHQLHRAPTDAEVAAEMEMSIEDFQDTLTRISNSSVVALDELWTLSDSSGDQVSLLDTIQDPDAVDPAHAMDATETKDRLADAIARRAAAARPPARAAGERKARRAGASAPLPGGESFVLAFSSNKTRPLRESGGFPGSPGSRVPGRPRRAGRRLKFPRRAEEKSP